MALGACVTRQPGDASPPPVTAPVAHLAPDWLLLAEEDSAELVYGVRDSDDVRLAVECRGGQDPVLGVTLLAPTGSPGEIVLRSGGKTQRYAAHSEADELSDGVILITRLARKTDPVFKAFRETGWLTVVWSGGTDDLIPQHNSTAVADFFRWCG